jgi:hypothetical protein
VKFELGIIDWTAISALSTFLAVLVALFYQPFISRRRLYLETTLVTNSKSHEHSIGFTATNLSAGPIWIVSFGFLYKQDEKVIVSFLGKDKTPKLLQPSEPISFSEHSILENLKEIDRFFAKDSYGKFWYLNRKNKKQFKAQIEICLRNNPERVKAAKSLVAKPK